MTIPVGRPLVSVVTPTRARPDLLIERALPSALRQSLADIEIVVVVDGHDPVTEQAISTFPDPRVRVIVLPTPLGGAEARNVGVRAARGEWIAFLDDDDEWLPDKLARQLERAQSAEGTPIVACGWITRTPRGDQLNPSRSPRPGEPLSEYMLARQSFFVRECGLVSTLLFVPRSLLLEVPFTPNLPRHQDWDWLLRVSARPEVHLQLIPETEAIWYYEEDRPSVSRTRDWRSSLAWAWEHRRAGRMTARAFVGFLNSHLVPAAQQVHDQRAMWPLLSALLSAHPRPFELLRFVAGWGLSTELRRASRSRLDARLRRLTLVIKRLAVWPDLRDHRRG